MANKNGGRRRATTVTMRRCRVAMTLSGSWGSEHLWPGLDINIDRELTAGFTVRQAVEGREDCFEDVPADEPQAGQDARSAASASTDTAGNDAAPSGAQE